MVCLTFFLNDFSKDHMKLCLSILIIFCLTVLNNTTAGYSIEFSQNKTEKYEYSHQNLVYLLGEFGSQSRLKDRPADIKNKLALANLSWAKKPILFSVSNRFWSRISNQHRFTQIFKLHCSYLC